MSDWQPVDPNTVIEHLAQLVAFPTVSSASNLKLLDYIEAVCRPLGARLTRFPDPGGTKANLLVSFGPTQSGGLVFSGHTDVVPTEGQTWTASPWMLRRTDQHVIGRGVTDMKGFLACCLAATASFATFPLQYPVHFAFSYDEEVGCTGVGSMAEWIGRHLNPDLAIIGEPTGMKLVNAHKGGILAWVSVQGKPGHSSQPDQYVNAVMAAGDIISFINTIRAEMRSGAQFPAMQPPYSTIQVNQIAGGLHGNIVAESCRFFWEARVIPGQNVNDVLARIEHYIRNVVEPPMQAVDPAAGVNIEIVARVPPLAPVKDPMLENRLLGLVGSNEVLAVPYGTEAGIFSEAGIPAVVIGPGDAADAHQPDEKMAISQLVSCTEFLISVIEKYDTRAC